MVGQAETTAAGVMAAPGVCNKLTVAGVKLNLNTSFGSRTSYRRDTAVSGHLQQVDAANIDVDHARLVASGCC